jgi:hypothetical protein
MISPDHKAIVALLRFLHTEITCTPMVYTNAVPVKFCKPKKI